MYVGRDTQSGRTVAIREFLPTAIAGAGQKLMGASRRWRTLSTHSQLASGVSCAGESACRVRSSAGLANYIERGKRTGNFAYMAMQYCPSETLRDVRVKATTSRKTGSQIQRWLRPMFEAVAELHARRVIHRHLSRHSGHAGWRHRVA